MSMLAFAEFLPDRPDLSEGTRYASGVIATAPDAYGPIRALSQFTTNALNGVCLGMGAMEDITESVQTFAGTPTDLFLLPYGTVVWENVSSIAGGYAPAAGENWRFAQFNEIVLATDYTDPIQAYTVGSSATFAELAATAPHARHVAVVKGFAIVANTSDPVGGVNPARLWWCANGDPTNWPTPGSTMAQQTQSDYNDLLGPQGGITGLAPSLAGCDCAVFFERAIWQMFYVGPPDIFNFYPCAAAKGCIASNSLVPLGSAVFGLFEDGFYSFDGSTATPIGADKVDRWFFANANLGKLDQVIGAPDIGNKAIIWLFQSLAAQTDAPDMAIIYRWDIQRWSIAPIPAQWISRIPVPNGVNAVPPYEAPLIAGQLQLGAINAAGQLAYFNGIPIPAQIGTKVVQITPGARSFVSALRPLIDGGQPAEPLLNDDGNPLLNDDGDPLLNDGTGPTITLALSARVNYTDIEVFGPDIAVNSMGECPQRSDGRYHRGLAKITSGLWNYAYGVEGFAIKAGTR